MEGREAVDLEFEDQSPQRVSCDRGPGHDQVVEGLLLPAEDFQTALENPWSTLNRLLE